MPKDIEPKDPNDDSGKGEENPKMTEPPSSTIIEEIPEVVNEGCPGAASPSPSPRVDDSGGEGHY
jgi:hypothetical protein